MATVDNLPAPEMDDTHRTVKIPSAHWWRRLFAFAGPAYMVSVGYMDPGNWGTDIEGGSRFGYTLIWVLLMSNAMAVLLQTLSARLGLVTGRDLAQACRDEYPDFIRYILFVLCEIAIAACDLAEVLGSAVGLNLLFHIPLLPAVVITAFDVLVLLLIQRLGIRKMEAFIIVLVATIGLCFVVEIFLAKPQWWGAGGVASGFVPDLSILAPGKSGMLYVAIGILGATVMPHNLYMHSSLVQSRAVARSRQSVAQACRYNLIDSVVAMNGAFLVNAAILIVAAAAFCGKGTVVTELQDAAGLLQPALGSSLAPVAFAVGLLCAGQSSTVTGTLAGQITMEGFLHFRMRPWLRRLLTRLLAVIPAVIVIGIVGDKGVYMMLIFSQVVLSMQLPFAVVPLVRFTSSKIKMGPFASPGWVKALAWLVSIIIIGLNARLVYGVFADMAGSAGAWAWPLTLGGGAVAAGLGTLLAWMIFKPERGGEAIQSVSPEAVLDEAARLAKRFERVGVALEAKPRDSVMLAEAIAVAKVHHAELILLHVVEGVGGQWFGPQTGDLESRQDATYLEELARRLGQELDGQVAGVRAVLGYGDVTNQLVRLAHRERLDLLIVGTHGHKGLGDLIHGATINAVRHGVRVPIFAVR
jgi:manganese transport protein